MVDRVKGLHEVRAVEEAVVGDVAVGAVAGSYKAVCGAPQIRA